MLVLAGTYPDKNPKVIEGYCKIAGSELNVGSRRMDIFSGTVSMAAACTSVCSALGTEPPYCVLAGDTGNGDGSRSLYSFLKDEVFKLSPDIITLHYIMPLIDGMVDFGFALEESGVNPLLIADAGAMYGAKISGIGHIFGLFTPDKGELAFLADDEAMHPMFVNENLYDFPDERIPELAMKVSRNGLSPDTLLVKGNIDYIIHSGNVVSMIDKPYIPAMEAVGGTGDTLTGIVSALVHDGKTVEEACFHAARINRMAGEYSDIKPNSHIRALINEIPRALESVLL